MAEHPDKPNPASRTDSGGAAFDPTPFWRQLGTPWATSMATSMDVWSAWADAWGAVMRQRGGPAAEKMLQGFLSPETWAQARMSPLLEELQEALALPRLADLPGLDAAALSSMAPTLELASVMHQYMQVAVPIWVKASQRFQAEVAERRRRGERLESAGKALDLWNDVLDRTLMEFNRSAEFGELQQRFLRAAMRQRLEFRKLAERAAEAVDLPTRKELDDVYARLHELLREVHGLRRELRALRRQADAPWQAPRRARKAKRAAGDQDHG